MELLKGRNHIGVDPAGRYRIHTNAASGDLMGQRPSEPKDGAFAVA